MRFIIGNECFVVLCVLNWRTQKLSFLFYISSFLPRFSMQAFNILNSRNVSSTHTCAPINRHTWQIEWSKIVFALYHIRNKFFFIEKEMFQIASSKLNMKNDIITRVLSELLMIGRSYVRWIGPTERNINKHLAYINGMSTVRAKPKKPKKEMIAWTHCTHIACLVTHCARARTHRNKFQRLIAFVIERPKYDDEKRHFLTANRNNKSRNMANNQKKRKERNIQAV